MKKILLLAMAVSVSLYGCIKSDKAQPSTPANITPYVEIDPQFASHFFFKKGTYWIYRDSLSGRMDSFYVIDIDTSDRKFSISYVAPFVRVKIRQKNIDMTVPSDSSLWVFSLTGPASMLDYYRDSNTVRPEYHYMPHIHYPLQGRDSPGWFIIAGDSVSSYVNTEIMPEGWSQDSIFVYTHRTNVGDTGWMDWEMLQKGTYLRDDFFMQNNRGIVKMRIRHPYHSLNYVWEMVRWHIVL